MSLAHTQEIGYARKKGNTAMETSPALNLRLSNGRESLLTRWNCAIWITLAMGELCGMATACKTLDLRREPGKLALGRTLGLPVVPLEKLKNASLVRASPGRSLRSVKVAGRLSPSATSSSMVVPSNPAGFASITITLSEEMPARLAASSAVGRKAACAKTAEDLLAVS
jgi:hypothetical protein